MTVSLYDDCLDLHQNWTAGKETMATSICDDNIEVTIDEARDRLYILAMMAQGSAQPYFPNTSKASRTCKGVTCRTVYSSLTCHSFINGLLANGGASPKTPSLSVDSISR